MCYKNVQVGLNIQSVYTVPVDFTWATALIPENGVSERPQISIIYPALLNC
jgi:hypothetical protein